MPCRVRAKLHRGWAGQGRRAESARSAHERSRALHLHEYYQERLRAALRLTVFPRPTARSNCAACRDPHCASQELQGADGLANGTAQALGGNDGSPARVGRARSALGAASELHSVAVDSQGYTAIGEVTPRRRAASTSTSRVGTAATASSLHSISAVLNGKLARLEELEARLANGGEDKAELDRALANFFEVESESPRQF